MVAYGSFSAPRQQEVILASGSSLHLHRLTKEGALISIARGDAFAQVRALAPFRLTGSRQDHLLVTSDSGALALLAFAPETRSFTRVRVETFGKSGCRRVVPGHFLAADPKGRACMVAAVERSKFAYVLTRDTEESAVAESICIQSPLEAHKTAVATHALVALDVAFENPMFAALEKPYEGPPSAPKLLVYYELDLGLNHVVRRYSSPVADGSFFLLSVPGGSDGPGGLLVCSPGCVTYRNLVEEEDDEEEAAEVAKGESEGGGSSGKNGDLPQVKRLSALLPTREGTDESTSVDSGVMVVSGAMHRHKDVFFFILCTEFGDLLKVELDWSEEAGAIELRIHYFDSLPAPAAALAIFRSGYLFAAPETGDPLFLKFNATNIAGDDAAGGFSSSKPQIDARAEADGDGDVEMGSNPVEKKVAGAVVTSHHPSPVSPAATSAEDKLRSFRPRVAMKYFSVVDILESLAPSVALASGDFCGEGSSQLVCASGRGSLSSLRVFRRGYAVLELMAQTITGTITGVFTLKERAEDNFERYIVVSFAESTKVLRVADANVGEAYDTGLVSDSATIVAAQVGDSSLLQVYPGGVRVVTASAGEQAVSEWVPAKDAKILEAAANRAQAVVALSTGAIVYFEFSATPPAAGAALNPFQTLPDALSGLLGAPVDAKGFPSARPALALPEVPPGRVRAPFFAASDGQNSMVRLYQIDSHGELKSVGIHMAPAPVSSLALVDFGNLSGEALAVSQMAIVSKKSSKSGAADTGGKSAVPVEPLLFLAVGTRKGALVMLRVDPTTGAMSGKRTRFLGPRGIRVRRLKMAGVPGCLAMSVRPWFMHRQGARVAISPLCTETMSCVSEFSSEQYPDGFVGVSGATLRFLSLESLSALASSAALPSRMPPTLLPADTALGSTFFMSKSSLVCAPRRLAAIFEPGSTKLSSGSRNLSNGNGSASVPNAAEEGLFIVLESEHRAILGTEKVADESRKSAPVTGSITPIPRLQIVPSECGSWASQIRLVSTKAVYNREDENGGHDGAREESMGEDENDTSQAEDEDEEDLYAKAATTLDVVPLLDTDACALCVTSCTDLGSPWDGANAHVIVSVGRHVVNSATSPSSVRDRANETGASGDRPGPSGELHVFKVGSSKPKLDLVHVTPVEQPVYAMAAFRDKLLAGVGSSLRLYDLGKKQLLRKVEARFVVSNQICAIAVAGGDRVFVGDVQDSVSLLKYFAPTGGNGNGLLSAATVPSSTSRENGRFVPVARDLIPRFIVSLLTLDYNTVCGSDKFGNVFVLRLPPELSGSELSSGRPASGGSATHGLATEACFHVGSIVMGLVRGTLKGGTGVNNISNNDSECIIYSTIGGAVGILAPFAVKSDADLAVGIEKEVRERFISLVGRSHVSYRSSFAPVRHVVDGDLCEMLTGFSREEQESCAVGVERDLSDVLRKLDEFRSSVV